MNSGQANIDIDCIYFHADADGDPNLSHPMSEEEHLATYRELSPEDPKSLADLYLRFHDARRVEFLVFKDRLSSAILVSNSAKAKISELESVLRTRKTDGTHRVPGWEFESDQYLEESLDICSETYAIAVGATIVTSVAALESLLVDLTPPTGGRRHGIQDAINQFLAIYPVATHEASRIRNEISKIGRRRNIFAHNLTGSYSTVDNANKNEFTPAALEDTLFRIGALAVTLENIVLRNET